LEDRQLLQTANHICLRNWPTEKAITILFATALPTALTTTQGLFDVKEFRLFHIYPAQDSRWEWY
jgi:adenine deaminase